MFRSPLFLHIAPFTAACQASFLSIQSPWSGPWLKDVAGLDRDGVASHLLAIAAAMITGFLTMGVLAERLARVGVRPARVATAGLCLYMLARRLPGRIAGRVITSLNVVVFGGAFAAQWGAGCDHRPVERECGRRLPSCRLSGLFRHGIGPAGVDVRLVRPRRTIAARL